jgi:hypothetical protein
MTNGERFELFLTERYCLGDWRDFLSTDQSSLSRRKILEGCPLARSTLYQNPVIKRRLAEVEAELQRLGILRGMHSETDSLSDETSFLMIIAEMEGRLNMLNRDICSLSSTVEDAHHYVQNLGAK